MQAIHWKHNVGRLTSRAVCRSSDLQCAETSAVKVVAVASSPFSCILSYTYQTGKS